MNSKKDCDAYLMHFLIHNPFPCATIGTLSYYKYSTLFCLKKFEVAFFRYCSLSRVCCCSCYKRQASASTTLLLLLNALFSNALLSRSTMLFKRFHTITYLSKQNFLRFPLFFFLFSKLSSFTSLYYY